MLYSSMTNSLPGGNRNHYFPRTHCASVNSVFLVALGGSVGAVLRWFADSIAPVSQAPIATLFVNLIGSFLLGAIMATYTLGLTSKESIQLIGVGLLGSFTTMSTYAFQTLEIGSTSGIASMAIYMSFTALGCPFMALGGWRLASALASH
jgi:CrcB protein